MIFVYLVKCVLPFEYRFYLIIFQSAAVDAEVIQSPDERRAILAEKRAANARLASLEAKSAVEAVDLIAV